MRWILAATIAIAMLPQGLQAQIPPDCAYCQDFWREEEEEWEHSFGHEEGAVFNCEESIGGGHPIGCEDGPYTFHPRQCAQTHPACGSLLADLEAVDVDEVGSLHRFIVRHAANVTVDAARHEVWVRDCGGAVIALLRLTG